MLYQAYELQRSWMNSVSSVASISSEILSNPAHPFAMMGFGPIAANALDVFAHATAYYAKPAFNITEIEVGGELHPGEEATVVNRPFGDLKRFRHTGLPESSPRVLIVAPMSGHYATLLRGTVERMLKSCIVYITDWADAKMVPVHEGLFDLDDYIDYLMDFLEQVRIEGEGRRPHMMAVCQPSVPAFAATALMNQAKAPTAMA